MKAPSLGRIVGIDSLAFGGAVIPPALWGFYLVMLWLDPGSADAWLFPALPAVITILGVAVVIWRVRLVRNVFAHGVEAMGSVQSTTTTRGSNTRIEFTYTFAGQTFSGSNVVSQAQFGGKPGDAITVVLDPRWPKRAFIRDLYA
jgi:hypothetical protein